MSEHEKAKQILEEVGFDLDSVQAATVLEFLARDLQQGAVIEEISSVRAKKITNVPDVAPYTVSIYGLWDVNTGVSTALLGEISNGTSTTH